MLRQFFRPLGRMDYGGTLYDWDRRFASPLLWRRDWQLDRRSWCRIIRVPPAHKAPRSPRHRTRGHLQRLSRWAAPSSTLKQVSRLALSLPATAPQILIMTATPMRAVILYLLPPFGTAWRKIRRWAETPKIKTKAVIRRTTRKHSLCVCD